MQENHLFEYAVIRVVPRVEREEFLNVGVILYCKQQKFLDALFTLNMEKLRILAPLTDITEVQAYLCAFEQICKGAAINSPIARLDIASRFRWLTATRSTIVQTSKVHQGLCRDAKETLEKLHRELVE
ncbi:MAG TPA: DUF3037 domain-containing protein [Chitinophaga sp.]|uniref:DUF3037 domain-containing protein n=1 Tax=Chitinophaga sp. TaxID=1869181 RepID=UPI002C6B0F4A|nr:DUF3037 domain-containing protein [Chitinophaga sp.]HVI43972.1 DUF3037 domain-containing protein [Chitinophaga sp.]